MRIGDDLRAGLSLAVAPCRDFHSASREASITDGDEDQAAAEHGQTADDDGEEASGYAIKVTHDTPLGSKGDGADQLIKTFGIRKR